MKKVLITLCIACMAISAYAVEIPKQGFGVQIGWAQPILRLNDPSSIYPKDSLVNTTKLNGFKVGVCTMRVILPVLVVQWVLTTLLLRAVRRGKQKVSMEIIHAVAPL